MQKTGRGRVFVLLILLVSFTRLTGNDPDQTPYSLVPVLVFDTGGLPVTSREPVPTSLAVLTPGQSREYLSAGSRELGVISVRGNSSFNLPKKSYRLELQNQQGVDRKKSLLDMPADSDWVLYASATDSTFTRNVLGHELWRNMGRYAVRWRFVEVFIQTNKNEATTNSSLFWGELPSVLDVLSVTNSVSAFASHSQTNALNANLVRSYAGLYVLMEKIKRGKERVSVQKLRPEHDKEPEITGGYIIKKDDPGRGDRGMLTGQELKLRFEEPKESELTPEQRKWMTRYLDDVEKALFSVRFRDDKVGYRNYLDVDSFIDFHWLVELGRNADGYWFSQYMHKGRGERLTMGPVWDWDNAFGNTFFGNSGTTNGWRFETAQDPDYTWYRRLFEDPDFLQRYVDRWGELRTNVFATSNVLALVDRIASQVKDAHFRNANLWDRRGDGSLRAKTSSFNDEINQLKQWLTGRLAWIDSQEFPRPVEQKVRDPDSLKLCLVFSWLNGRLFYTTDGTDPRAPGGAPSAVSREYSGPILVSNTTVTARVRSNFGLWSAPVVRFIDQRDAD